VRTEELRELPEDELYARLDSAKEELFNLRFQLATGQLDNPMRIKEVRHNIARIMTVLTERDLAEEPQGEAEAESESVEAS
jgi:large subunit ribosomal protein L29